MPSDEMTAAGGEAEYTIDGVVVQRNVPAPMRDGTVLRADVYRPQEPGQYPALVQRTPYDKTVAQQITYQHPIWYARQGYVVVVQDPRGRFASDGEFRPFFDEATDTADTIAWAAKLPFVNGKVGTYGFSYPGANQLLGASEGPEGLVCIAPGFSGSDFYDGWTYVGGALCLAFLVSWVEPLLALPEALKNGNLQGAISLASQANNFPGLYWTQPLKDFPLFKEAGVAPYFFDWLEHDTRDDYWQSISIREKYDRITVPCFHYGGWYDSFIEGTLENYASLAERAGDDPARTQRLVIGPWVHIPWAPINGVRNFGDEARNSVDETQLEWFDYWLKGKGDLLDRPPVRLFVMGENRWRDYDAWPPSNMRVEEWYLHSSGRATSLSGDGQLSRNGAGAQPADVFVYNPGWPVPSTGGRSCCVGDVAPMGPFEQSYVEIRNDVLVYSTPVLEHDVEVTGTVELVLYAATDAVDTDWTAKLVDVDKNGHAINLCDGIVRARFRDSLEHPTPIEPNRVYEYRIRVGSTANLFKAGHRIRLEISSSNFPAYDINPNNGQRSGEATVLQANVATQAVFHDGDRPSRLLLPVVPR
jgi:putative CocE/NonD family hydrolase